MNTKMNETIHPKTQFIFYISMLLKLRENKYKQTTKYALLPWLWVLSGVATTGGASKEQSVSEF